MATDQSKQPRPRGTAALYVHTAKSGQKTWYARYRIGGKQVRRALGPVKDKGAKIGLNKSDAEAALRRIREADGLAPPVGERLTFDEASKRYLLHIEHVMHRKRTTITDYDVTIRKHFKPAFGKVAVDDLTPDDVRRYIERKSREKRQLQNGKTGDPLSAKTIHNQITLLSGVLRHAVKRGWASRNVVEFVDRPQGAGADPDLRFLDQEELEALLRAAAAREPKERENAADFAETDHAIILTAALTGLRQGELVALRWKDVDWAAGVIRVRQTYSLGEFTKPKSRRSSRAVPMADRVGAELDRHFKRSVYRGEDDLVFGHPQTGHPLDVSALRKRYEAALAAAQVRRVRFHDLRHTFGTRMAAAGAPLRSIMEWMGHRDFKTTLIYADYAPDVSQGAAYAAKAFGSAQNGPAVSSAAHDESLDTR
jgi:integrase